MENYTEISAGGMEIRVSGNNVTFTIGKFVKRMDVASVESMLETHTKLKNACRQIVDSTIISVGNTTHIPVLIDDAEKLKLGVINAAEALNRAD